MTENFFDQLNNYDLCEMTLCRGVNQSVSQSVS